MSTRCTPTPLEFHAFGRRQVVDRFDAGRLTFDGGAILLRELDRRLGPMRRVAGRFTDDRDPDKVEHSVLELAIPREQMSEYWQSVEEIGEHIFDLI